MLKWESWFFKLVFEIATSYCILLVHLGVACSFYDSDKFVLLLSMLLVNLSLVVYQRLDYWVNLVCLVWYLDRRHYFEKILFLFLLIDLSCLFTAWFLLIDNWPSKTDWIFLLLYELILDTMTFMAVQTFFNWRFHTVLWQVLIWGWIPMRKGATIGPLLFSISIVKAKRSFLLAFIALIFYMIRYSEHACIPFPHSSKKACINNRSRLIIGTFYFF